jgi:tRNA threonylcarbamoyladenosine biosynthesis protein TsaB
MLLAIETATELVGVALAGDDGVRAALWATGRRRHTETLAPAIGAVLAAAGATLDDVDTLAVDVGPGLFTGLRVGIATAQGLARGLGVGIVAVSSTEALASRVLEAGVGSEIVAVVDARRAEVFAARYAGAAGSEGRMRELAAPHLVTPAALAAELAGGPVPAGAGRVLVGDGARRYAAVLGGPGTVLAGAPFDTPDPGAVATLARAALGAGADPRSPEDVLPHYLREADARRNWVERPVVSHV